MQELSDFPEWFEALTLAERAALLEGSDQASPLSASDRALRRLQRWRDESGLLGDPAFAERLAFDGLTLDRFLRLLDEPAAGWQRRAGGPPTWLEPLTRAFASPEFPRLDAALGGLGLLELLRPLIEDAHAQVLEGLHRISVDASLFDPGRIAAQLLDTLFRRLRWASERVLALELQVNRLEGKLQGETSEERFSCFVSSLREPGTALAILRRYPVLARDACRHTGQWTTTSLEMMERFAADRNEIFDRLAGGQDAGTVVAVACGLSDRHAGGRSVAILTFASGLRAVYKPKPLAVDRRFQELIAGLNERGASPPLRCVTVLDHGPYGWMEHVSAHPCETVEEVERFHRRQGAWVALFYALEATDFHHENLIAAGEHPVPIDLETLLQPALANPPGGSVAPLVHTVLHSGLLPWRIGAPDRPDESLDLSGMGAVGGQVYEVKRITEEGTDRMRWASAWTELQAGPHLPTLRGAPVELWEQRVAVLHGFRSMYRLLERHREELLGTGSSLLRMTALPVRALLRPTNAYAHLFHVGNHPDYLQSGLDRDRLFDRLWLDTARDPSLRRAVRAEQADMAEGDIPRFTVLPDSTDLLAASGRIDEYFAEPGIEQVHRRFQRLGEEDLERQCWLVGAALEATRPLGRPQVRPAAPLPDAGPAMPEQFLEAARRLGDRLACLAVEQGDLVSWFHLRLEGGRWCLEPVSNDLYSGLSGIALFFAHLGCLTGSERYEALARRATATVQRRMTEDTAAQPQLGAFSGLTSAIYAFTHLGLLWGDPDLLDEAEELAARITPVIETDTTLDLIGGSAGSAVALLALHRHRPSPAVLQATLRCGERLLATAIHSERGIGWPPFREIDSVPLTGFGHGTAGIAWALARLARATGQRRFEAAARGAMSYERSWFCPEPGGWPDLRGDLGSNGERSFLCAWCHGAPGIGLGRIGSLSCLDDPEMGSEIRAAVHITLAEGFGLNHSLCHGDLGNLELLREAGRVLADEELTAEAPRLAARILRDIETAGPRCGVNLTTEIPGLMTGLAGIGYGLLRTADPQRVPSVLLLETPPLPPRSVGSSNEPDLSRLPGLL